MKKLFVRFKYHEEDGAGMNASIILSLSEQVIFDLTTNKVKSAIFYHPESTPLKIRDIQSIDILIMTVLN